MSFTIDILDNGLTVITDHMKDMPFEAIRWQLSYGARHDQTPGTAHFFEHLLAASLTGNENMPMSRYLNRISKTNGFATTLDWIDGRAVVAPNRLPEILNHFALTINQPEWNSEIFETEKARILNEFYQKTQSLYDLVVAEALSIPYSPHPVGHWILGNSDDINSINQETIETYHNCYFGANNMALIVSGPATRDQVLCSVSKHFSKVTSHPIEKNDPAPIFTSGLTIAHGRLEGQQEYALCFEIPHSDERQQNKDWNAIIYMLNAGLNDCFNKSGFYANICADCCSYKDFSQLIVSVTTNPKDLEKAASLMASFINTSEHWLTEEYYDMFKEHEYFDNEDTKRSELSRVFMIGGYFERYQSWVSPDIAVQECTASNLDSLTETAKSLDLGKFNIITIGPIEKIYKPSHELGLD